MQPLDYWPEFSKARYVGDKYVEVLNALPYRVGDNVRGLGTTVEATIEKIEENKFLSWRNALDDKTVTYPYCGSQL